MLLHPDKDKCAGVDGALTCLDNAMRSSYDLKRNFSSVDQATNYNNCSNMPPISCSKLDTFWTICTTCKLQYEYMRKYVNTKLSFSISNKKRFLHSNGCLRKMVQITSFS